MRTDKSKVRVRASQRSEQHVSWRGTLEHSSAEGNCHCSPPERLTSDYGVVPCFYSAPPWRTAVFVEITQLAVRRHRPPRPPANVVGQPHSATQVTAVRRPPFPVPSTVIIPTEYGSVDGEATAVSDFQCAHSPNGLRHFRSTAGLLVRRPPVADALRMRQVPGSSVLLSDYWDIHISYYQCSVSDQSAVVGCRTAVPAWPVVVAVIQLYLLTATAAVISTSRLCLRWHKGDYGLTITPPPPISAATIDRHPKPLLVQLHYNSEWVMPLNIMIA